MITPVVHIHDLPTEHFGPDGSALFGAAIAEVGEALGSTGVRAMFVQVEPGKRAIFAMTRFSGAALDYAYKQRQAYSKENIPERVYANDELFMFSYLLAAGMFRVADRMIVAPDWFVDVQFDTAPDLLVEHVEIDFISKNKILHPVVDRKFFKKALAKRMVGRTGVLAQSRRELNTMTSVELDEIADIARAQLREHLRAFEARN
jgi:hypothetical protein